MCCHWEWGSYRGGGSKGRAGLDWCKCWVTEIKHDKFPGWHVDMRNTEGYEDREIQGKKGTLARTYARACRHACTSTHARTHSHTDTPAHCPTYTYTRTNIPTRAHTHAHVHAHAHTHSHAIIHTHTQVHADRGRRHCLQQRDTFCSILSTSPSTLVSL